MVMPAQGNLINHIARGRGMSQRKQAKTCALCTAKITTQNDSLEHIIPAAIGGRRKVKGFICRACNNNTGKTWDKELISQLHLLCLIFGVARQRGSMPGLPIITTAGEELTMISSGMFVPSKPSFLKETTSKGTKFQITARTEAEAKKMITGAMRRHNETDIDNIIERLEHIKKYPEGILHHQLKFGGEASGRSIVKSTIALAHYVGLPIELCNVALDYLRNATSTPCFGYYYSSDILRKRPTGVPIHCIGVAANPDTGLILGYAEYFGVWRVALCLGRNYTGKHVQTNYTMNPMTGKKLELTICLKFNETDIENICNCKEIPDGEFKAAFGAVMQGTVKRNFEAETERVLTEAVKYAFANSGATPGENLTEEQTQKVWRLTAEKITPFILRHLR